MADSSASGKLKYKRVLLKLSGEALQDKTADRSINPDLLKYVVSQIQQAHAIGVQVALVIGGGNIFRGLSANAEGMDRTRADFMGMLATIINSLALQDALENVGLKARLFSGIAVDKVAEPVDPRKAVSFLEKGGVAIFAAGTGNPFFTTDTAAALRAVEVGADILFKATKVDGVYDCDPVKNPDAKMYDSLSYMDVIRNNLGVMDITAISLCRENELPVCVFNMNIEGNIIKALQGDGKVGTIVS